MKNKRHLILVIVVTLVVIIALLGIFMPPRSSGLANPASVYCQEQGGKLDIRTGADGGQVGMCIFPDGSECEEWAFFRKECKPK